MSENVLIANHHMGQIIFPRALDGGLYAHITIEPGEVMPVKKEFWESIKETPQIQHLLKIGKLSEVKEQFAEVPVYDGPTSEPPIPEMLQDEEPEVIGNVGQDPAKAKAKAARAGTVTI